MSRQIDQKTSVQVRIDKGWHRLAKIYAASTSKSIKEVLEEGLAEVIPEDFMKKTNY